MAGVGATVVVVVVVSSMTVDSVSPTRSVVADAAAALLPPLKAATGTAEDLRKVDWNVSVTVKRGSRRDTNLS